MDPVDELIYQFEGIQQELMLAFHQYFVVELGLTAKIRYKLPFYYSKSWICYLNPIGNAEIELAFTRGNELFDVEGILEKRGRKQVYGIVLSKKSDLFNRTLMEILQQAILLDKTIPYASKRKSNEK